MNSPVVSVIIPCYNYGHFLGDCLSSVMAQTFTNLEILVVDDGSTDNTREVALEYGDRLHYLYKDNGGLSSARTHGLQHATGDYLLFLDADDLLHPDSVRRRVRYLEHNTEVDVAICRSRNFSTRTWLYVLHKQWPLPRRDLGIHLSHFNIAPPHAFLSRRSACLETGVFDESLRACEDYDYWIRMYALGKRFRTCDGLVFYRRHRSSMSAQTGNQWRHDLILHSRVFRRLIELPRDLSPGERLSRIGAFLTGAATTLSRICGSEFPGEQQTLLRNMHSAASTLDKLTREPVQVTASGFYYLFLLQNVIGAPEVDPALRATLTRGLGQFARHSLQVGPGLYAIMAALSAAGLTLNMRVRLFGMVLHKVSRRLLSQLGVGRVSQQS